MGVGAYHGQALRGWDAPFCPLSSFEGGMGLQYVHYPTGSHGVLESYGALLLYLLPFLALNLELP